MRPKGKMTNDVWRFFGKVSDVTAVIQNDGGGSESP